MRGIRKTKKVGHGTSIQECGDRQPAIYLHPSVPLAFQISVHCVDGINRHYISSQDSNFPDKACLKDILIIHSILGTSIWYRAAPKFERQGFYV